MTTRRERRASVRGQHRRPVRRPSPLGRLRASPLALLTALIVGLGVLALVVVVGTSVLRSSPGPQALSVPAQLVPAALASDRSLGKPAAPVKLDLWEDFQCPFCAEFTRSIEPGLVSQYVVPGTARITFHDLSFLGNNHTPDESNDAAVAARCAQDQGHFWRYMQYLYANQGSENSGTLTKSLFDAIATKLGLQLGPFDTCLADPAKLQAVRAETAKATTLGITGTPSLFVNGRLLPSALDLNAVSAAIDAAAQGTAIPGGASQSPAAVSATPAASGSAAP